MSGLQPSRLAQSQVLGPTGTLESKGKHPGMVGGVELGGGSQQGISIAPEGVILHNTMCIVPLELCHMELCTRAIPR